MPAIRSHGRTYIEPERHDELTDGIPDAMQADARLESRAEAGRFAKGARAVPALGGKAKKGRTYLSHHMAESPGLTAEDARRARKLRTAMTTEIASTVGGGVCGVAASLLVKFAAQKTAAAEAAFRVGDHETHRKLSESARMDLMYAREHAAKTALARRDASTDQLDPLARFRHLTTTKTEPTA